MIPKHTRIIIIGGGVMGCGLAYHLAKMGEKNVTLLEKAELTSGSTWHAAGQITHSTSNHSLGKCVGYNIELYSKILEAETEQSVTWHGCGSLRLAYSQDEYDWLKHTISVGSSLGFPMEIVDVEKIKQLHPFYNLDGVIAALHTPEDGHVDPAGATFALAKGARQLGANIIRNCRATNISLTPSGEWKVQTEQGDIICEHVVNAGGTYAKQVGSWVGLDVPTTSMTHHYFITDPVPEFTDLQNELPVVRDDKLVSGYIRMEQKSGLIGIYEKANPNAVWLDGTPWEAENELFAPDYDRIMPWLENALERMPIFAELGIKREVHGAISHPPDGNPLIGPAPNLRNFWLNCGCQIGIGWGPGLTRELARWILYGAPDINMRDFDPRRFGNFANKDYQITKAKEDYLLRHEIPFPHFNRPAGRPHKTSPLYEVLHKKGAVHEEVYGWERPRWFARNGLEQRDYYSFKRAEWHDAVAEEVKAVQEYAGIMDISSFAKVRVSGKGAAEFIDSLIPNKLPKVGAIGLTHLLSDNGRIMLETGLVRMDEDCFYFTCAAFFEQRLLDYLDFAKAKNITIENLSDDWSALTINGPESMAILQAVSDDDVSFSAFPWLKAKEINVAGHKVWALRMSYAGENGFELHGDSKGFLAVYDALTKDSKLCDYGSFAMNSMRLEKMFKGAGELTNEVTLPEADVMRFVDMGKEFVGKEATEKSLHNPLPWRCVYFVVDGDGVHDGHGGEAMLLGDKDIGVVSSIAYGHRCQTLLGFGYMDASYVADNFEFCVMVMGEKRKAVLRMEAEYDKDNLLPRGKGGLSA